MNFRQRQTAVLAQANSGFGAGAVAEHHRFWRSPSIFRDFIGDF